MTSAKPLTAHFVGGAIAAVGFLVALALDAASAGVGLVCLIGIVQGALPRHELLTRIGGMLTVIIVFAAAGLLLGHSTSAGLFMVPLLSALILLYATGAFFISLVISRLCRRLLARPGRDR